MGPPSLNSRGFDSSHITLAAPSALESVAVAAEGAGHIIARWNLPYHASPSCCSRYLHAVYTLFELRRDPGNDPHEPPDSRIKVAKSDFALRRLVLEVAF